MALFGPHFDKPGKGVRKDEAPQPAPVRFFAVYTRKFWYLVRLNLLYAACCALFCLPALLTVLIGAFGTDVFYLSLLPLALTGPFTAGFVYVLRDFVRERPSFLWQDYRDAARGNIRQALVSSLVGTAGLELFLLLLQQCAAVAARQPAAWFAGALLCMLGAFFLFAQYYVYLILVTFRMGIGRIWRNAFIFSVVGLGRNLLVFIVGGALVLLCWAVVPLRLLFVFITLSTVGYLVCFAAWPLVKKYMFDPQTANETPAPPQEPPIFSDESAAPKKRNGDAP